MSKIDETEDELSCSFCKERFSDVIKFIHDCGNNICGRCYEDLKDDVDEKTEKEYKCVGCGDKHTLPPNGLRDNKALLIALSKMKPPEKRLHPNAKKLRDLVKQVQDQMEKLQTFDGKQFIELECGRLEQELSDAIESAVEHLKEIEKRMMKKISEYRERCIANLSKKSSKPENTTEQQELKEVSEFNTRWNSYFKRIEIFESESDIEAALAQTGEFMLKMELMEERMRKEALNWEKMVFNMNTQFLEEWNHVGEIEIVAEQRPPNQRKKETSNTVNSTPPKKMTIQQTPSFTLTGHSREVRQVLFLPDGRLASCSYDKTIKIWNVENGKELFKLTGHTSFVWSIAFLPNGHLASCSEDKTIKIWDLEQRKEIRSIQAHSGWIVSLRVLKNGNLASYSWDDTIKTWNLNSKENELVSTMSGHGNDFWLAKLFGVLPNDYLVTCYRSGDLLSFALFKYEECILRVWKPNEPNTIKLVPTGFNDARSLLVLSNDQVALGFKERATIKIIDLNNNALSRTKERAHDYGVYSLAQLSNGNLISAGMDDSNWTIKVWNLVDWTLLKTINTGHSNEILSLCVSGDERFLASGSWDSTIKLWPISIE